MLECMSRTVRRHVVQMSHAGQAAHVGSALSCVDLLVALYFDVAKVFPDSPLADARDRIILSKGHASAALYACLAERGFFATELLRGYASDGSPLSEHPSRGTVPGVECSTGSLGHGLGIGSGIAVALRQRGTDSRVFVVMSDGECNEGSTWEAALWAPAQGLDNLTAIVDFNGLQATGRSRELTRLEPLGRKWQDFGWDVSEVDGHNLAELTSALRSSTPGQPRLVLAHTVKGKGVSFMEDDLEWHYRPPSADDVDRALAELGSDNA